MTNLGWRLVEVLALQLAPAEREAALGDLIETQSTAWQAICEVLGLVARRQLQLWSSWRPWLAAPGLAFPCSLVLLGFSFAISTEFRGRFFSGGPVSHSPASPTEPILFLCQIVVLLICSWTAGFTVESLSRKTFLASAVCCFLPCLFCLMRFHHESLSRLCLLLFLFPGIAGVGFSRCGGAISRHWAIALALGATISIAVLAARGNFWALNWELIVPAWYLAVRSLRSGRTTILENGGGIR
jgi:hypothetical protein